MKPGFWMLAVGMALGLAGGFLLRPLVMSGPGDLQRFEGRGAPGADAAGSEALPGKSGGGQSARRSAGSPLARLSSGDAVMDVRKLIASLEGLQSENQLNPMDLIRRMYLLTQLREGEVMNVLADLSKVEGGIGKDELRTIAGVVALSRLAELNGPEAMRLIHSADLGTSWDDSQDSVSITVMTSWVAADPDGARRWFEAGMKGVDGEDMKELMENDDFRQAYYDGLAKHDPEALAREIGDESDPGKRDGLLVALVRNASSPDELVGLLDRSGGAFEARSEAIGKLTELDPAAAAAWVEKQPADHARDDDIATVASAMMDRDGEKGIEWYLAQELAGRGRKEDRLSTIVHHLASRDPEQAARWVESQPDDAVRDAAEIAMAWQVRERGVDQALDWLMRVGDAAKRNQALETLFRTEWSHEDARLPDHVIEAAEQAGVGDAARNYRRE